ncbi:MAG: PAS domain S-box protein [Pontibacter sp.]|nr:PAS domain S-box protein [Pontibacter sp.]
METGITREDLLQQLEQEKCARQAAEKLAHARLLELEQLKNRKEEAFTETPNANLYTPLSGNALIGQQTMVDELQMRRLELQSEMQDEYPNPMLRLNYEGDILYLNRAGNSLLQEIKKERVDGLKRLLLFHIHKRDVKHLHGSTSFESYIAKRYYHILIIPMREKGYCNVYMSDITERREAEAALEDSQNFIRNIVHTIPNIVYIYDVEENQCIYINGQVQHVLGYNQHDLAGMGGKILSTVVTPEYQHKMRQHALHMLSVRDGDVEGVEYLVRTKSGDVKNLYCRESVFKRKENGQVKQVIGSAEDVTRVRQQRRELLRQKEFYESILNHIPSDVAVYNRQLQYLFVNPAAVADPEMREWLIGKTNEDYSRLRNIPPQRMEYRSKKLDLVLERKDRVEFEESMPDRQGGFTHHIRRLNPVLNNNGEVELIIGHGLNITDLRLAQEEIIASEAKNRAILAAIPDLIFIIDKAGQYLDMKNVDQKHLLIPKEDVVGSNIYNLLPDDLAGDIMILIKEVIETGYHRQIHYDLELPNGLRHYEGRILKYSDDEVLAIIRDVTDEKKATKEVREKNEFISQVLDASPSLIYVKDGEGNFVLANQEFSKLFRRPLHELIGHNNTAIHPNKDEVEFYLEIDRQVILENREIKLQERFTDVNGDVQWFNTTKKPIVTSDGQVHVLGISTNVTEQREANKRLQNSEELHRLLSENSKDMVSLHNLDGSYIYVSKAVEEMLGYTQAELLQMRPTDIVHPADIQFLREQGYEQSLLYKKNTTIQHRLLRRDGAELWVETNIRPILNEIGEVSKLQAAARDITERRKADEALKSSEKKYRDLINYSQAFICTHDLNGSIQSVNPYLLNMLGYTSQEMIGHKLLEFFPEEHRNNFYLYLEQFNTKNVVDGVLTILNKEK